MRKVPPCTESYIIFAYNYHPPIWPDEPNAQEAALACTLLPLLEQLQAESNSAVDNAAATENSAIRAYVGADNHVDRHVFDTVNEHLDALQT